MHPNIYNLKKKLYFIKKNPEAFYKKPYYYLKVLKKDIESIDATLALEIEVLDFDKASIESLERLLARIMLILSSEEVERNAYIEDINLNELEHIGPKTLKNLIELGIKTVYDLITYFPIRYECLDNTSTTSNEGVLSGFLINYEIVYTKTGKKLLQAFFKGDLNNYFYTIWLYFNKSYPFSLLKKNNYYYFYGALQNFNGKLAIFHPEFIQREEVGTIRPVYALSKKIRKKVFMNILTKAIEKYTKYIKETLNFNIINKYAFPSIPEALKTIHFPSCKNIIDSLISKTHPAIERFIYEELFYLQLGLLLKKINYEKFGGISFNITLKDLYDIKQYIPFKLTLSQKKVLAEIINDMRSHKQMNRLLQGDVGSGKTVVALAVSLLAIKENFQVAIIAPTEVLAEQHYDNFNTYLKNSDIIIDLITGSTPHKRKNEIKERTFSGKNHIIIGTHALIQDDVNFNNLGLAIVDEQHRFGVIQRKALLDKGYKPDILLMTATPIPRSLALTFYGDLNISIIDELPPGRKKIITKSYSENNLKEVYKIVNEEILKGFKAYFVYPLISESDKLCLKDATNNYNYLSNIYGADRVGLLHGKLSADEKRELINNFKYGKISILVSTTVIEVGVDIPNATIMVVENAERFGLSQLHQLRGRIGRSSYQSYCILVHSKDISEEAQKRINTLVNYNDGFKISEVDLDMRGPGDFFGTRQSGLPEFKFSNIVRDIDILKRARNDAIEVIKEDPDLVKTENHVLKKTLLHRWNEEFNLSSVG
jgi:ATP-dependent DNA helicase RecG